MSKRRRRDDGGDFAFFTLPFEHLYWAMAYAIVPMILSMLYSWKLGSMIENDTMGIITQVAQQYGMVPMYAMFATAAYGFFAWAVHLWREYNGYQAY